LFTKIKITFKKGISYKKLFLGEATKNSFSFRAVFRFFFFRLPD